MKIFKKEVPIYFGELVVVFNDNFLESFDKLKIKTDFDPEGCRGLSWMVSNSKNTRWLIFLEEIPTHETIAHETLHTTHRILQEVHHTATFDTDEPECYLHGWLTKEIYKFIKKNNIEIG